MKKKFTGIFTSILALSMAAFFVACGDGSGDDRSSGTDNTVYTVTAEDSDYYDVGGQTTQATAGTEAYVIIEPEYAAVSIEKVFFNGQECTESSTEENKYTFTMPAENVEITVNLKWKDVSTDNFLTWNNENPVEFEIFAEPAEDYFPSWDDGELTADVSQAPSQSGGFFSAHDEKAFSLNKNVIPDEALSVSVTNAHMSTNAVAFVVHIDRTKIKEGTAQIVLRVENGHKFEDAAVLVCTVTIVAAQTE